MVGPPSLEFAPYNKIPSGRKRNDARQATIDQDPDFIEFLQSLTNPIVKPALSDTEGAAKREVVTTTPLIEHLREKKAAAKEKPSAVKAAAIAAAKHGRQESKESPKPDSKYPPEKQDKKIVKSIVPSPEKGKKLNKAAREAVKVLNREAAAITPSATPPIERKRERIAPAISVAAKIQRDLGLAPAGGRRSRREPVSDAQPSAAESSRENVVPSTASTPSPSSTGGAKKDSRLARGRRASKTAISEKSNSDQAPDVNKKMPTGPSQPTILKKPAQPQPPKAPAARPAVPQGPKAQIAPTGPAASQSDAASAPALSVSPSPSLNRQAFLKHANPSQGITEVLIEEALSAFGKVDTVEIDRKKGFAYVTFGDNETLRKACAAGSVKVAQGAVQVLERRDRPGNRHVPMAPIQMPRGGFRGGRGGRGRGGGRGGINGVPVSPIVQAVPPIAGEPTAPASAPIPTPAVDV